MQDETKRYQCRHIFTDGRRCGSPCLRQEEFCYYHHTTRRPVANPGERRARQAHFHLPLPEDRAAIQISIGEVLRRIAANEIDPKRAGLLLYGLQIASLNLPRNAAPTRNAASRRNEEPAQEPALVEEIVLDPELGTLAPRAEVAPPEKRQSVVGAFLEYLHRQDAEDAEAEARKAAEAEAAKEAGAPQPALSLSKGPALEDVGEASQNPHQACEILPTLQASEDLQPRPCRSLKKTQSCLRARLQSLS